MVFYKQQLVDLAASEKRFSDIYNIMYSRFKNEIFGIEFAGGFDQATTYAELYTLCENIAGALHNKFGDGNGRCIALRMNNSVLWVGCFFGALMAGFKPVLINTRLDENSIALAVKHTKSIAVLFDGDSTLEGYINASQLSSEGIASPCWENEIILMTSGTTGEAKLVVYSGSAICHQVLTTNRILKEAKSIIHVHKFQIRLIALLPFYHIFGLSAVLLWFSFFGRTMVFPTALDADAVRFACKRGKVTHFFAIPAVWNMAARTLVAEAKKQGKEEKLMKGIQLSTKLQNICPRFGKFVARKILFADVRDKLFGKSVSFCISGGGFLNDDALKILNGIGYTLHVGYGMTETGITAVETSEKPAMLNLNTVGKPLEGVEYKIDENGILCVRGELLHKAVITKDGRAERNPDDYFVTQDHCTVDKSGRWILLGRDDDIIIGENGENISPDAIQLQLNPPACKAFCVTGLKIGDGNERPVVIMEFDKNSTPYEKGLATSSVFKQIEALPITLRPAAVYTTTDEIPVNLGKIKRAALKKAIKDGDIRIAPAKPSAEKDVERLYDESYNLTVLKIKEIFAQVLDMDASDIDTNANFIYDFGGSSMAYYNLMSAISSAFGVELKMDSSNPMFTPAEFARGVLDIISNQTD